MRTKMICPCTDRLSPRRVRKNKFTNSYGKHHVGNLELLEKAFTLAESGAVSSLNELRRKLMEDGITIADLEQFHGRALARQLCGKIALSKRRKRKAPQEMPPWAGQADRPLSDERLPPGGSGVSN